MKPNHSNSDIYGDIDSWSLKEAPERLKVNSDNLKERIEQILNKVSLYASDWYDDDNDDGLNEEEATAQLLQFFQDYAMGCVPDRADSQKPELYGNYFDGYNHCREAMLINLEGKS